MLRHVEVLQGQGWRVRFTPLLSALAGAGDDLEAMAGVKDNSEGQASLVTARDGLMGIPIGIEVGKMRQSFERRHLRLR